MKTYYRIALVAHAVCERGNEAWACYEELKLAGHAVEILDPQTIPTVLLGDGTLNQDALEAFRRVFAPDYVAWRGETAQEILRAVEASGAQGSPTPFRHVVVFGYVGMDNYGDELIFSQICERVRRHYPGSYVTLIGYDPAKTLARYGVSSAYAVDKPQIHAMLNGASALVFMAGLLFDEPFDNCTTGPTELFLTPNAEIAGQTAIALMAQMLDVPIVYLGIGAGPLENPDSQALVRLAGVAGGLFVARDQRTRDLLLAAGVPSDQVPLKADVAFSVCRPTPSEELAAWLAREGLDCGSYAVVALRDWSNMPEGFEAAAAAGLDRLISHHGVPVVMADFAPEDREIHERVRALMICGDAVHRYVTAANLQDSLALIASSRLGMAMRLHLSIVSNSFGVPSIGFDYLDKVGAFYRQMGRERFLLPMGAGPELVVEAVDALMGSYDEDIRAFVPRVEANRVLVEEAFDLLWQAIDAHEPQVRAQRTYPRIHSLDRLRADELEGRVASLQAELDAARAEIDAVRASHSYRVGNLLLRIPSAIKRRFGR